MAGGLSAAVILIWWPRFFPTDDAATWLIRGVIWTLSSELLILALLPIERALWESRTVGRVRSRAGDRFRSPRRSLRGRAGVACAALAVPVALLVVAPPKPAPKPPAAVRHVTEVKRIVKVERQVRVAQVVPAASTSPQPVAASSSPAPVVVHSKPAVRSTSGTKQATPRKAAQTTGNSSSGTNSTSGGQTPSSTPDQVAAAPGSTGR